MLARKALPLVALVTLLPLALARGGEIRLAPDNLQPLIVSQPISAAPPVAPPAPPPPSPAPYAQPTWIAPPASPAPAAPPLAPAPVAGSPPANADGRLWLDVNPLIGWLTGGKVPPLVTSSVPGTPRALAGVEGLDSTRNLFGDHVVNGGAARAGILFRAGYCPDANSRQGLQVGAIWLQREGDGFTGRSDGNQILARPFINLNTGLPDAELIAYPGVQAGEVHVRTASDLLGAEVNYRCPISCCFSAENDGVCCDGCGLDALFGYRGLRYRDKVTIDEAVSPLTAPPATDRVQVHDAFYALNVFNGLQVGLAGRLRLDDLFIDGRLMTGLGGGFLSSTDVNGSTTLVLPSGLVTRRPVGLLATASNSGGNDSIDLAFAGEFDLRLGYQIRPNLTVSVGYASLYLSSVKRAGEMIDQVVNTTQLPPGTLAGPARPMLVGGNSDVWARAVTFGLEWRY